MRVSDCILSGMLYIFFMSLTGIYPNSLQINNQSLQDMYIFGDPLLNPIIIVEHLTNVYRSTSVNSNFVYLEDEVRHILENGSRATNKLCGSSPQQNGHVLKVVVFVHGFQACLTFLQLLLSSLICLKFCLLIFYYFVAFKYLGVTNYCTFSLKSEASICDLG